MLKDNLKAIKVKETYRLKNWSQYNAGLKNRGSLTIWFEDNVKDNWYYKGKRKAGGIRLYSDIAIEFCLTIRSLFGLPYRQTEGFVRSLLKLSGLPLVSPSYSQFNRRTKHLNIKLNNRDNNSGNIHIALD
jgi:Transposase DDE domain